MQLKKLLHHLTKWEKVFSVALGLTILISGYQIAMAFYYQNSESQPVPGGVYIEGAVGQVSFLNPLFVRQGTIESDMTQLIFSGLTRYNPETGEIESDLAEVKKESDGKKYTFVLKEGAKWHDGEPVTADDVIFTYNNVIKSPEFEGVILSYNDYSGTKINKIDERTVEFLLEESDSFFLVKTMVGILPKHLLENEPVDFLETSPFNFNPIGSGRYKFVSQVEMTSHTEYGLEAFEDFYDGKPNIESILFKVFDSYEELEKNLSGLNGIRNIPPENTEDILKRDRFSLDRYQLPQYVAIFINNESSMLKDNKVRLGLKLGTDKEFLVEKINQSQIIDTPLLEIKQEDWRNQYSVKKANGALFETEWQIPNKEEVIKEEVEAEEEVEESPTAEVTYIKTPNEGKDFRTTSDSVTIAGDAPTNAKSIFVNDYELQKFAPNDPSWSYVAATKFDSLKKGKNIYEIYAVDFNDEKTLIDAITIQFDVTEKIDDTEDEKREEENKEANNLPIRENEEGEKLSLRLITSNKPATYAEVAQGIKQQWRKIGVDVQIEVLESEPFQERLNSRDYDLLIFGQNLGYNLDAFPYWHSSQAKEGGLNLSQFKNFVVDSLLEKARLEDNEDRQETLNQVQEIMSTEVPAIFLYSPTRFSAISDEVNHPPFTRLATTSDRLGNIENWFAKADRQFKDGTGPLTFFSWVVKQF